MPLFNSLYLSYKKFKGGLFIENYEFTYWDYLKCIGKYDELSIKNGEIVYSDSAENILSVCEDEEEYQLDDDTEKIEQQSYVDYSMPYRILNYCVETIRLAVKDRIINNKYYKFSKVIPIVLYIGNNKWTASTSFADCEVKYPELNFNSLETKFKLIDINNFTIEDLLNLNTMVANTMILEKCKNNDEVLENLKMIINNLTNQKSEIKELKHIVSYLYSNIKNINEILSFIEESEVNENMSTVAERLREEYINKELEGISKGMTQGISQIIKNMLNYNVPEKDIMKYAKINKQQFEKIKKEFENEKQ